MREVSPLWFVTFQTLLSLVVIFLALTFCGCGALEPYDRVGGAARIVLPAGVAGDYFSMRVEVWVGLERRAVQNERMSDTFAFPAE